MNKRFLPAYIILTCLLIIQTFPVNAQMTMVDYLRKKFQNYCTDVPREEVFVNSDRDEYISGEDMWFTVYLFDRQSQKPSDRSSIVYVELLNPENRPVMQMRIGMNNGTGAGYVSIPDTLTTGTYILRAYTSWMKNFLPVNSFVRKIRVWNALSSKGFENTVLKEENNDSGNLNVPTAVSRDKSISFDLRKTGKGMLQLTVVTDTRYRSGNNNLFYLFIQTHGKVDYVAAELLAGDTTRIIVPEEYLSPGINQATLFNLKGQPVCERYLYTPDSNSALLSVNAADSTGCRSRVSVNINLKGILSGSVRPGLSVSVTPAEGNDLADNIENYMIFGSEFGIIDPHSYSGNNGEIDPGKMDSLLLKVHSNWIDWNRIISFTKPDLKYSFEKEFHWLTGSLVGGGPENSVSGNYIFLSKPGKTATFKYARTDDNGNFIFGLHIDETLKDLIIQPEYIHSGQNIKIESPFSDTYLKTEKANDSSNISIPSYISGWGADYQVRKIYSISSTGTLLPPVTSPPPLERFYGKPDVEINMADYIKLPVMQEVFFELITGVFLKEKNSVWEITITDPVDNVIYSHPPALMIDGVIIKDASAIAGLDPEVVEKIDVVREEYMVGDYLFYGLVNVITNAGDFSNGTLPDEALSYPYRVLNPVSSFSSPDYSSAEEKKSRIPDFRTTLYWDPSVQTGKDGKATISFWTSDLASDYEIKVQGVTPEGRPVWVRKKIKVQK